MSVYSSWMEDRSLKIGNLRCLSNYSERRSLTRQRDKSKNQKKERERRTNGMSMKIFIYTSNIDRWALDVTFTQPHLCLLIEPSHCCSKLDQDRNLLVICIISLLHLLPWRPTKIIVVLLILNRLWANLLSWFKKKKGLLQSEKRKRKKTRFVQLRRLVTTNNEVTWSVVQDPCPSWPSPFFCHVIMNKKSILQWQSLWKC